jgi:hypothetical protein
VFNSWTSGVVRESGFQSDSSATFLCYKSPARLAG